MPGQIVMYLLGGIFVIAITILGTLVSEKLIRQDQVVSFEAPMNEFIQILSRELEYNAYALRSLAQLFRSSESVEEHEFESFAALLLKQYGNISALAFLPAPVKQDAINGPAINAPVYWRTRNSYIGNSPTAFLPQKTVRQLIDQAMNSEKAVASPIVKAPEGGSYYAVVLQKVAANTGMVMMVIDVSFTLERIFDNQVTQGYALFEREANQYRLAVSTVAEQPRDSLNTTSGDHQASVVFFERNWQLVTFQNREVKYQWLYIGIPLAAFVLSILIVYLIAFSARLRVANREKERNLSDLQFAQKKLVEAEKIAAMGGVVAGVAHEVNTPLGIGITCMSHLQESVLEIKRDFDNGKLDATAFEAFMISADELVSLSMKNMRRAASLLTKFKKVDVIGSDSETELELVVIADLIDSFVVRFYNDYPDSTIKLTTHIDQSITLYTYPAVILDILSYLTSNAMVHAFTADQQDCEISITFPHGRKGTTLLFKDNGAGVEKSLLKRIVDPFFTTRRGSGFAGLGLSVVYNLVSSKLNSELTIEVDNGLALSFDIKDLHK
ncbi:ATP-binding protein [Alteromonas gilva]|uniref:ATP-binding protein n=1 Tax=Alteromonas gilva TaxID=2987522 RepID=A0ABT5L1V5_9ALTE|nr:ATP-binding protein [Alteromonas gilva]MDC8830376.1 ATP-binding protein [Alteromonas gilva]